MPPDPDTLSKRYRRCQDLPFQKLGEEIVVVAPREWKTHLIEGVGSSIWQHLASPHTGLEIIEKLLAEFDVAEPRLREDVEKFLQALITEKLIEIC